MSFERRVLVWMCVLIAVNQIGFGGIVPVMPLYALTFGVSASAIGLAVAIYGLARFCLAMPAGQLSDRLGRRPTLALGGLVSAAGSVWCALATGYPEFIVARFVAGAGAGLVLTTGQVVLADITTPERRGRTMAIYQGTFIFAVGIGPFPGGLIAEYWGLAAPFWVYGGLGLTASAIAWFAVGETRGLGTEGAGGRKRPAFITQIRMLSDQVGYLLVCTIAFMNGVVRTGGLFTIIPVLGATMLAMGASEIGLGLALGSVMGLLAAYPTGMLIDRFGRKAVIVPATLLTATSMVLFCLAPSALWFIAACVVWGIAASVGGSAPAAYAADSAVPGMNAAAMSTFRMAGDLGYVIGPISLGFVVDAQGPVVALLLAAAPMALVGLLFARLAPETYRAKG